MQFVIDGIRKMVVLVLLMELVLQIQSGKQYEPYIKWLVGIMIVYTVVQGVLGSFESFEERFSKPMQEFQWSGDWYIELEEQAEEIVGEDSEDTIRDIEVQVKEIIIEPIQIGGLP